MATRPQRLLHAVQNPGVENDAGEGLSISISWRDMVIHVKQLAALEKEVRERAKKDTAKEAQEAEQPIINPLARLMITQGNGFVFEVTR